MAFRFTPARDSESSTYEPPSVTLSYVATGSNSGNYVRTYALTGSPPTVTHEKGLLYRQDVKVDPVGYQQFRVSVPYGPRPKENGKYKFHFSTLGGSLHIQQAVATKGKFAAPGEDPPEDMGGLIGVNGDNVDGVEIVQPALSISVTFQHPEGVITMAQAKALARLSGKINSTTFMTFAPGEILFLGCEGDEGTESETSIRYEFAASENINGQQLGIFEGVTKRGWDHAWVRFKDSVVNGHPTKEPRWLFVDQVYREADLASILGFGGG